MCWFRPAFAVALGVFPDDHPLALGAVGSEPHDCVNLRFDQADTVRSALRRSGKAADRVRTPPRT
jgi:acetolactate synthase-1/2/3 large subunit